MANERTSQFFFGALSFTRTPGGWFSHENLALMLFYVICSNFCYLNENFFILDLMKPQYFQSKENYKKKSQT